jgi:microsomal dipeptidase-like Zn-dependent dipeptidase
VDKPLLARKLILPICTVFASLAISQAQIRVTEARIGCLDVQKQPNLTALVGSACNGKMACSYRAPTEAEYRRAGVPAATRALCSQAMEIKYQCGNGGIRVVTVPGDAWNHPPAALSCEASPSADHTPHADAGNRGQIGTGTPEPPGLPRIPPPPSAKLRGFVDLHTHPLANLGFGGKLFYGGPDIGALLPADPDCHHNVRATSEQQALGHDKSTHGGHDFFSNPCGDELRKAVIHGLQQGLHGADETEDASGYPTFSEWPVWNDLTHQKMWVEWIRRAYHGGLRVMVALAVNNKTLGDMTAGPGDYPTDDKSSADRQIEEIKSFVARHGDFMEVAYTSADLHRIVSANKLAVVVGLEIDHIGNFQTVQNPAVPSDEAVRTEIGRLHREGVRYIFPVHVLDNAFGGSAAYVNLFDVSNVRESGHPYDLVCASPTDNITYRYDNNDLDTKLVLVQLAKTGFAVESINTPQCPNGIGQKNRLPLTARGITAIKEMMRLGMLIDIDHMSQAAADQALGLAWQFHYPVNSGHNGLRGAVAGSQNERALRADQYATIGKLHGMAGVGSAGLDSGRWLSLYNHVVQAMGGGDVVAGFGTDTNGFALGMPRRASSLKYSSSFPPSRDGQRTWDYNRDGVAHYGMLWDFLEDVRTLPGGATVIDNNFMYGADYFFRTWQIAESQAASVK